MARFGFLIFSLFFLVEIAHTQSIRIEISGIRSDKGVMVVSLFENQKQFKSDQPVVIKKFTKEKLKDNTLIVRLNDLTPNAYGIVVLDDENNNGEMDYQLTRPTEGFGFSNYFHKGLFRPKFDDFSFELKNEDISVDVVMRYIKEAE